MGMTITEKIFAASLGVSKVSPGQIVTVKPDAIIIQDATGALTYDLFRDLGMPVAIPNKVHVFADHYCPPGNQGNAERQRLSEYFCRDFNVPGLHNMQGISHQWMVEGTVKPGRIYLGADSHTTTYGALGAFSTGIGSSETCAVMATGELWLKIPESMKIIVNGKLPKGVMSKDIILKLLKQIGANGATYKAMEFCGETISDLSVESRLTITNMTVEAGAKNGIIAPDEKTVAYMEALGVKKSEYEMLSSDADAVYSQVIEMDVSKLEPQVAIPYSPANGVPVGEVAGTPLNQILFGACTNGRIEDIKILADALKGKKVKHGLKVLVFPGSNKIVAEAARLGYIEILADAGCTIGPASCGACGIQNPLVDGENCLATNNRNFKGRMGSPASSTFVASPMTAAASALTGVITDPRSIF
jgi:homoaconitate hydratase family protein